MPDGTVVNSKRMVIGVILRRCPERYVSAVLLRRRWSSAHFDLPGGQLLPDEMPIPGLRRTLALSLSMQQSFFFGHLKWEWLETLAVTPHGEGSIGAGFALSAWIDESIARTIENEDTGGPGSVFWGEIRRAREWLPRLPAGAMLLLFDALRQRAEQEKGCDKKAHVLPVHEDDFWPSDRQMLAELQPQLSGV
jgi:hypothetical protein